ncbi:MAG: type 1 glutamine amidotransferase [Streptosporangiales bacterium]|nr:type 1 glutamine amidotransferase [Streptosporangiales bacterium]
MASELKGLRVAFLTANEGIEQVELTEPWQTVRDAGGVPELVAPKGGKVQAFNHLDKADTFTVHRALTEHEGEPDYDAVVLPGGVANGDALRMSPPAVTFMRHVFEQGKPVAVICHGGWILVEADLVRGRTMTSWPSLRTDIRNAGGNWTDTEVQVCDQGPNVLISSRNPGDLPAFNRTLTEVFARQAQPA